MDTRRQVADIIAGRDDRLLVIVGPCSIHDPEAALDYASRLKPFIDGLSEQLCIVMRVYFEKPRTTIGWKGLINDPNLNGQFNINQGLRVARGLLLDLNGRGIAAGTEFLDTITPQFTADLVSWGAIGARTTESQVHRELASGLSMPVGFKNGTGGTIQIAIDGVRAARHPHHFLSVTKEGIAAIVSTTGNESCHVVLRGSTAGANYVRATVDKTAQELRASGLPDRLLIDCSHGNSDKNYSRQPEVAHNICEQISSGSRHIGGVMLESHLVAGRQDHDTGKPLTYGQSITDGCISWDSTAPLLETLAAAVTERRRV
jgi:3-deoxy-7-phosphoheptulonate synthase